MVERSNRRKIENRSDTSVKLAMLVQRDLTLKKGGKKGELSNPGTEERGARETAQSAGGAFKMEQSNLRRDTDVGSQDRGRSSEGWDSQPDPGNAKNTWNFEDERQMHGYVLQTPREIDRFSQEATWNFVTRCRIYFISWTEWSGRHVSIFP